MNLFDNVKLMYESELYDDVNYLGSLILTLTDHNGEVLTGPQKYQTMVYYANSLYNCEEYRNAEDIFRKALVLKKMIIKAMGKTQPQMELTSDVDVKYKIHQCNCKLKQLREAMNVLESISTRQRTPKINIALANLYQNMGMDRSAITCYKEVIRECPMAMKAVKGLMSLGIKGSEVAALVLTGIPHGTFEWFFLCMKANSFLLTQDYQSAISSFKLLDSKAYLKDNPHIVSSLGETCFLGGDYNQAMLMLQRVHALDPSHLHGMDILGNLYAKEKKVKELESLAMKLMAVNEHAPQPWIVFGYFCKATKKLTKAVYFAQKAYTLSPTNVEAFLLKGAALFELKKIQDASHHYLEALRLSPHQFEAHVGLIDCYIAAHRLREAMSLAQKAIKTVGNNSRTVTKFERPPVIQSSQEGDFRIGTVVNMTIGAPPSKYKLYASVLMKQTSLICKAKQFLEKAMKMDTYYLEPVYLMAEILIQEQHYDKGKEILRKQLHMQNTCRLHVMLADCLAQTNDLQDALDHYCEALSLDPSNTRAREGIDRVEKQSDRGLDTTYDLEVEAIMEGSDNEGDYEGSDVESTWSETELT